MVVGVAQHQAGLGLVKDDANVAARTHRPEVLVFGLLNPVQAHAGVRRVQLQVKRCGLDRFLLVASQARQAVGEGVGYAEVHDAQSNAFRNEPLAPMRCTSEPNDIRVGTQVRRWIFVLKNDHLRRTKFFCN